MSVRAMLCAACVIASAGCGPDLGECDESMLGGMEPNTPHHGQALVAERCASSRCHSETAKGAARNGAPAGLNFDVVAGSNSDDEQKKTERGESTVHEYKEAMWAEIDEGSMPPRDLGTPLNAAEKETVRNWLACGAPAIKGVAAVTGNTLEAAYPALQMQCLSCHANATKAAGEGFVLGESGDACSAYRNIVGKASITSQCKDKSMQIVVAGNPDASLIVRKLEGTQTCGDPMPYGSKGLGASSDVVQTLRAWITAGALPPMGCQ